MSQIHRPFRAVLPLLVLIATGCQAARPLLVVAPAPENQMSASAPAMPGDFAAKAVPIATFQPSRTAPGPAPKLASPEYENDSLLVALQPGITADAFKALEAARGMRVITDLTMTGHTTLLVGLRAGDRAESAKARLAAASGVAAVFLNMKAYPHSAPNDEYYGQQWAHKPNFANTEGAWSRVAAEHIDASFVVIADVDSGVADHIEFQTPSAPAAATGTRLVGGYQPTAYAKDNPITDPAKFSGDQFGHGTFTAGIAAAEGNNTQAIAGVAWQAKILAVKVDHPEFTSNEDHTLNWGKFSLGDVVAGIKYACDNNDYNGSKVRVINMSLGQISTGVEPLYVEAVAYARRKGILCVASTGNGGSDAIPPPANTPGVVAVGATSHYLNTEYLSPDSNYGARIDLVAPGGGILSTVPINSKSDLGSRTPSGNPDGSYFDFRGVAFASGTSEAAPFVTGVAALVFAKYDPKNASLSNPDEAAKMVDRVRAHLLKSVDDLGPPGWDPGYGAGRINADKALADPLPLPDGPAPAF
jgi:subtilisin family serine protease